MKTVTAFSRDDFRKWLAKHHEKEEKVAVVVHKKHTGKPAPSHRELIEEAICYGWIDTTVNRLDEETYLRNFSKRNKNSKWSDNTLRYAKEQKKLGKMVPAGLHAYKEGLKRPTHDAGIPKNPSMPAGLKAALAKDKQAEENFKRFPPSTKRTLYRWLLRAKRDETKAKRIDAIVANAKAGKKNMFGAQGNINA